MGDITINARKYINLGNVYSIPPHVAEWWSNQDHDILVGHVFRHEDIQLIPKKYRLPSFDKGGDLLESFGLCWSDSIYFTVTDQNGTTLDEFLLEDTPEHQQHLYSNKVDDTKFAMYVMEERKGSVEVKIPISGRYIRDDLTFHAMHFYSDWGICEGVKHRHFDELFQWKEVVSWSYSEKVWIRKFRDI